MINRNKKDLFVGWVERQRNPTGITTVEFRASTQPTVDEIYMFGHLTGHDIAFL